MENEKHKVNIAKNESITILIGRLERREIDPAMLDKKVLRQCALCFKTRGYSSEEIAEILCVNERTVQRYVDKMRKDISILPDPDFHTKIASSFLNNWEANYHRLLKLSYSEKLSDIERVKTISLLHQLDMTRIAVLERIGYMSQAKGAQIINNIDGFYYKTEVSALTKLMMETLRKHDECLKNFRGSNEERKKLLEEMSKEIKVLNDRLKDLDIRDFLLHGDREAENNQNKKSNNE